MPILNKLKQKIPLDENDIIMILQKRDLLLEACDKDKAYYIEEIKRLDEEIATLEKLIFESPKVMQLKKREKELRSEYKNLLVIVCEKESLIHHVWFDYRQLPYDIRIALEHLYVSPIGWKQICDELHCSKNKVCKQKDEGLNMLLKKVNN